MLLSVLIVEDDPVMRHVLKRYLEDFPNVDVVGEAGDGEEALRLYEELRPKVMLVDIDLPLKNGLELAQEISDINPWCYIVFCTAHMDFREKAFELYVFDYIVKPFDKKRFFTTINRIVSIELGRAKKANEPDVSPVEELMLFKDTEKKIVKVDYDEIIFITREDRKTLVYYSGGKVATDKSLSVMEEQLRGYKNIFRSHKSFIINIKKIKEIIPCGRYTHEIIMADTNEKPLLSWEKLRELEGKAKIN